MFMKNAFLSNHSICGVFVLLEVGGLTFTRAWRRLVHGLLPLPWLHLCSSASALSAILLVSFVILPFCWARIFSWYCCLHIALRGKRGALSPHVLSVPISLRVHPGETGVHPSL